MGSLDRKSWQKQCVSFAQERNATAFLEYVREKAQTVRSYETSSVYFYAFLGACLAGEQSHAQIIQSNFLTGNGALDISMGNYIIIQSGNLDALKVYSSLVDMNAPKSAHNDDDDCEEDWCHIQLAAIYNYPDLLEYCHDIGYAADEGYTAFNFVCIMVTCNHFDSARSYAKKHPAKPDTDEWNRAIADLARNHEGSKTATAVDRLTCLHEIYPDFPAYSFDPYTAIHNALGNRSMAAAQYFVDAGAPVDNLLSTEAVEAIFDQKYGYAYVYNEVVDWLTNLGATFNTSQTQRILRDRAHRKGGEVLINKLTAQMDDADVPWTDMLIASCGTDKNDVINRMVHLRLLHKYTPDDYIAAIAKLITGWRSLKLIKAVQTRFNVNYNQSSLDAFFSPKAGTNASTAILEDIILSGCVDITHNDNEALYNAIDDVIRKGGRTDNIVLLLNHGADMMGRNGEIYERVRLLTEKTYRPDLIDAVNPYLAEDKRLSPKTNY